MTAPTLSVVVLSWNTRELTLACLRALLDGDRGGAWNLGTGAGTTNLEVIAAVSRATGRPVPILDGPRRPGDPAELWADPRRAMRELGWSPVFTDMCSTSPGMKTASPAATAVDSPSTTTSPVPERKK